MKRAINTSAKRLLAFLCMLLLLVPCAAFAAPVSRAASASQQVILAPTLKSAYSKKVYRSLRKEMDAVIRKKGFSDLAKQFLHEILLNKLQNYNQWRTGYLDMPDAKAYLRENLIDALKNVKSITLVDENSRKGKKLAARGWAPGETDGDLNIFVMYHDPDTALPETHLEDLEKLDHEIKHCKDKKVLSKPKHYKNNFDLRDLLIEGGATFHQKFVGPLSAVQGGAWTIGDGSGTKQIAYEKNNCYGYLLHLYLYETLVYLAGYRTVEDVSMGQPVMSIKKEIAQKYGAKAANRIWNGMLDLHRYFEEDDEDVDLFRFAVRLHKQILKCMQKDIERLNEKKPAQVRRYTEVYRYYKLKVMPKVYQHQYTDITDTVFDTAALDKLLIDKIIASRALPQLLPEQALNRSALQSVLYTTTMPLPGDTYYYVPPTLSNTTVAASATQKGGKLVMKYRDENNETVRVVFLFDRDGIQKVYGK